MRYFELQPGFDTYSSYTFRDEMLGAKRVSQEKLQGLHTTMDDREELGDIMGEMLEQQQNVEVSSIVIPDRCSLKNISAHFHRSSNQSASTAANHRGLGASLYCISSVVP